MRFLNNVFTALVMIVFILLTISFISCGSLGNVLVSPDGRTLAEIKSGVEYEYYIGDRGPAGGIVFYIFNDSKGRHFLEAAPNDLPNAQWGLLGIDANVANGAGSEIGLGKRDTERLVEALNKNNESGRAAQLCAEYSLNGFNDWFLPSYDEMVHMYNNLGKRGIGDFKNNIYWSSAQTPKHTLMGRYNAWGRDFNTSTIGSYLGGYAKDMECSVRAIRMFTITPNKDGLNEKLAANKSSENIKKENEQVSTKQVNTSQVTTTQTNTNQINESQSIISNYESNKKLRYSTHPPNCCHNTLKGR